MLQQFMTALDNALRKMDSEACNSVQGYPTGLAWYGGHREPHLKRPRTECSWSLRLAELLTANGMTARAEVAYPAERRLKCDNVFELPDGSRLWMENKGAWREYWRKKSLSIYRSYLLHPLVAGLDPKTHTVPLDLEKLSKLQRADADYVGYLLLGFDSAPAPMEAEVDELISLSDLRSAPWQLGNHAVWDDPYRPFNRVHYWFWFRPVA